MIDTVTGVSIDPKVLHNYFHNLVNQFFKILPMREQNEESLTTYMKSLQAELLGWKNLVVAIQYDPAYLVLLAILQYLIDEPGCSVRVVKREVFRAISICNKLKAQYTSE